MAQEMRGKVVAVYTDKGVQGGERNFYLVASGASVTDLAGGVCLVISGFNDCVADRRLLQVGARTVLRVSEHKSMPPNKGFCLCCRVVHAETPISVGDAIETIEKFL